MQMIIEKSLRDFDFWSGGADRAANCSPDELDSIEEFLEEIEPEGGWTDTAINDMFWFEFDTLAQHLGYENEEDFDRQHDPDWLDDDQLEEYCQEWFTEFIDKLEREENHDLIIQIATNLLNMEDCPDDEETGEESWEACLDYLRQEAQKGDYHIRLYIFDDDCGEYETDGAIPSWENFREEMMLKHKSENPE